MIAVQLELAELRMEAGRLREAFAEEDAAADVERLLQSVEGVAPARRTRIFVESPDRITETMPDGPQERTHEELEAAGADPSCDLTWIRVVYKYMDKIGPEEWSTQTPSYTATKRRATSATFP
jgi:hypothetical protein